MKPYILFSLLILFTLSSCEKYYEMDLPEVDKRLVLEGVYTNEYQPCTFILSNTTKYKYHYDSINYSYEKGARLIISDETGNSDTLSEIASGRYSTHPAKMQGIIGRSYKLDIVTSAGKHYISNSERMQNVPKIDSLYYERDVNKRSTTYANAYLNKAYIDWRDPKDTANYLMLYITYYWNGIWQDKSRWCQILNDNNMDGKLFKKWNIISEYDGKYFIIKVNFYSLTKDNYDYWNILFQQMYPNEDADVNASVPLIGNIYSATDSKDYVLGYFQVSATSSKQVYVDH